MSKYWTKQGAKVLWNDYPVRGADAGSFTPLDDTWAKDFKNVYCQKSVLRGADVSTFEVLNPLWARDKTSAYYTFGRVAEAIATTFKALDTGVIPLEPGYGELYGGYATDEHTVFFYLMTVGKPSRLLKADASSFQVISPRFGRDKRNAYYERNCIQGADPNHFTVLGGLYSTDGNRVFYGNHQVVGAHAASFAVSSTDASSAFDQSQTFERGRSVAELENDRNLRANGVHRLVSFSPTKAAISYEDSKFVGLEEELGTFLTLCSCESIEKYEAFTRGKRGEKAILRSIEKLNAHLPKPLAVVSSTNIDVTPEGIAAYEQFGKDIDRLKSILTMMDGPALP
jgi:DKNYY family